MVSSTFYDLTAMNVLRIPLIHINIKIKTKTNQRAPTADLLKACSLNLKRKITNCCQFIKIVNKYHNYVDVTSLYSIGAPLP